MLTLLEKLKTNRSLLPPVTDREALAYEQHFQLLQAWNDRMNLVSRKSIDKAFAAHYADSIQISDFASSHTEDLPIYDLGTGAGFPGIIFGIRYPEKSIGLFEKSLKKQTFLSAVVSSLSLTNVSLLGAFPEKKMKGFFFARAVHPPEELFRFFLERTVAGSRFVLNVGGDAVVPQVPQNIFLIEERAYELPEGAGRRRALVFSVTGTKNFI